MVDHERNVTIVKRDDHGKVTEEHTVTDEAARALLRRGFELVGGSPTPNGVRVEDVEDRIALAVDEATTPLLERIAELEAGGPGIPTNVKDVEDWVAAGTADRAQAALDAEKTGQNRPTLIAHLEGVLNPPPGDKTAAGGKES